MNPIISKYIPFMVKTVTREYGLPKDEKELIEFCQELTKYVIWKIEPIKMN